MCPAGQTSAGMVYGYNQRGGGRNPQSQIVNPTFMNQGGTFVYNSPVLSGENVA